MMEILPGVHQIPINYKGRPLKVYLIRGPRIAMLMDMGEDATVHSDVLPYFQSIGFSPKELTHVMGTHPDMDHVGGIHAMKAAAPQARFVCGTADREQIETPEGLADIRARAHYYWHGLGPDDEARQKFIRRAGGAGKRVVMDEAFQGGETLPFDDVNRLHVLHLPGHSHGHLGVFLPWLNAAFIGDAVHGTANRFLDGRAAFAPTYMYVAEYLGTIGTLRAMKLDRLFSCHWPDCTDNAQVESFLRESRDYAWRAQQVIGDFVKAAGDKGVTLRDVCMGAKEALGNWPAEKDTETRSMACGHLQRLVGLGLVREVLEPPVRYIWEPEWKGLH
jgi:glyoxylase-like metal-dependent hydrolase (beta-lactamase superfamily II)